MVVPQDEKTEKYWFDGEAEVELRTPETTENGQTYWFDGEATGDLFPAAIGIEHGFSF